MLNEQHGRFIPQGGPAHSIGAASTSHTEVASATIASAESGRQFPLFEIYLSSYNKPGSTWSMSATANASWSEDADKGTSYSQLQCDVTIFVKALIVEQIALYDYAICSRLTRAFT